MSSSGFSSDDKPAAIDPDKLDIPVSWVKPTPILSVASGMHRWLWDLRPEPLPPATPGGRSITPPAVMPGIYTVKLTVGDKTYTRSLVIKADPRLKP